MRSIPGVYRSGIGLLDTLAPAGDLVIRLWLACVFFQSGLAKLQNWQGTLYLFRSEYQVPLLPPVWAAYAGTAAELILPVLLAVGLATRFSALALFAFNIIAVLSYPELSEVGLKDYSIGGCCF